jgi:hypothetical protein
MLQRSVTALAVVLTLLLAGLTPATAQTPPQIYGTWHCSDDYCTWATVRDMVEFDAMNHWIVDRGDGVPSVNLVILSFVNPLRLLNKTTDAGNVDGVPIGMNQAMVDYFKSHGIRVALSIGGFTYTDDWTTALGADAVQLGLNAAELAESLGVGIEIDYEENTDPDLIGLEAFINAYRSQIPYDPTGLYHPARLTIDLAAGDRYLIGITRKATEDWLTVGNPVLDYANAMVPARQPNSASTATGHWQEHVDGKPQYAPPIPPLAPAKFTGALFINGNQAIPECIDFYNSLQYETRDFVQNVAPNGAGVTPGMLGWMFWAAGCPSTRNTCTTPPDPTCEGGMGVASAFFDIPVPMPALRDQPVFSDAWLEQVQNAGGGQLSFQWVDAEGEDAYEVYRGDLTAPFTYNHSNMACGLAAGATSWLTPDDQITGAPSYYYLVVPRKGGLRGWGADGTGMPRPPAAALCP